MRYSIIVPVYNRPQEVEELLASLVEQTVPSAETERGLGSLPSFEVIVVEDGSSEPCREVALRYADRLDVQYFFKDNSGPGPSRNYGAERARGEYLIILDSDVVLPPGYLAAIDEELTREQADAWGGPDRAHPSFTPTQKAINYAMTSFFTTGGIRGSSARRMDKFYPRSFNMGLRCRVYQALGGFSAMRFGEDIDLSIRIYTGGYRCRLMPGAWVWHKRRTDLRKFFRQVHCSGMARINLYKLYPHSLKVVHLLPAVFTLGCAVLVLASPLCPWALLPLGLYCALVCVDAGIKERSLGVGLRAVAASLVQLWGYGSGFWRAWWVRCVRGGGPVEAYRRTLYK